MAETPDVLAAGVTSSATNPYLAHLKLLLDAAATRVRDPDAAAANAAGTAAESLRTMQARILSRIETTQGLPGLPEVLVELDRVIKEPRSGARQIADVLMLDPSIAAKVLGLVNSVSFGLPGEVTRLDRAIAYLGIREVRSLAMAAFVVSVFPMKDGVGFDHRRFWKHSLAVAIGSRQTARSLDPARAVDLDGDDAFLAGLLHDVGKIYLANFFPTSYAQVLEATCARGIAFEEAEICVLGARHTDTGRKLVESWAIPDPVADAIRFHHDPCAGGRLSHVVHVADHIARGLGYAADSATAPRLEPAVWSELDLGDDAIGGVVESVVNGIDDACAALRV